jgi:hypothetical protein
MVSLTRGVLPGGSMWLARSLNRSRKPSNCLTSICCRHYSLSGAWCVASAPEYPQPSESSPGGLPIHSPAAVNGPQELQSRSQKSTSLYISDCKVCCVNAASTRTLTCLQQCSGRPGSLSPAHMWQARNALTNNCNCNLNCVAVSFVCFR